MLHGIHLSAYTPHSQYDNYILRTLFPCWIVYVHALLLFLLPYLLFITNSNLWCIKLSTLAKILIPLRFDKVEQPIICLPEATPKAFE